MSDSMQEKEELRLVVRNAKVSGYSIIQILKEVLDELDSEDIFYGVDCTKKEMTNENLTYEITKVMNLIGMPANLNGYDYIRYAVIYSIENPTALSHLTKKLYPAVGKEFNTNGKNAERNIRNAIETLWKRGHAEKLKYYFGYNVPDNGQRPTSGEFITMLVDSMKVKYHLD